MSRRRSLPWIYRWSRPLIGAIAILGAILTGYLAITSFTGGEVGCVADPAQAGVNSCQDVLSSAYATVFGLPLSFFGTLAYLSMAVFALAPLAINRDTNKKLRNQLEQWTWLLLLVGGVAMTVFSGYLMYLLAFEIRAICWYCIGSATFSTSLLLLTIFGRDWDDVGQILFTGIVVGMVTLIATLGIYSNQGATADGRVPIPIVTSAPQAPRGWPITTTSGESEIALAEHLTQIGARMFAAFWCPHCFDQKQLFGQEAVQRLNVIECDPNGVNPQPNVCVEAGVESYPTWEINGEIYRGTQTLEQLARISEYTGPTEFRYVLPGR